MLLGLNGFTIPLREGAGGGKHLLFGETQIGNLRTGPSIGRQLDTFGDFLPWFHFLEASYRNLFRYLCLH